MMPARIRMPRSSTSNETRGHAYGYFNYGAHQTQQSLCLWRVLGDALADGGSSVHQSVRYRLFDSWPPADDCRGAVRLRDPESYVVCRCTAQYLGGGGTGWLGRGPRDGRRN